jgi:hypothetical protein
MLRKRLAASGVAFVVTLGVGIVLSRAFGLEPSIWIPAAFTVPSVVAISVFVAGRNGTRGREPEKAN